MSRHRHRNIPPGMRLDHQEPEIEHQEPKAAGAYWPDDRPMPETYRRHEIPCPECRRVRLDNGQQAVSCRATANGLAYMRCRSCGHQWRMPIDKS